MRMFSLIVALFATLFITACGGSDDHASNLPPPKVEKVLVPTLTAEQQSMNAKAAIESVAKKVARSAAFKDSSGCNVTPAELADLRPYKDFPLTGPATYKTACKAEVLAMKQEAKDAAQRLAAAEKRKQERLAVKHHKMQPQHKG
jgi:hypothetical protein